MSKSILDLQFIAVEDIPGEVDLVAELRKFNSIEHEVVWGWVLSTGAHLGLRGEHYRTMDIVVNGRHGALAWPTERGSLVPVNGTNTEDICYRLAGLDEMYVPAGSEVPVEVVYAAVEEFVRTHRRPTCVEWQDVLDPDLAD